MKNLFIRFSKKVDLKISDSDQKSLCFDRSSKKTFVVSVNKSPVKMTFYVVSDFFSEENIKTKMFSFSERDFSPESAKLVRSDYGIASFDYLRESESLCIVFKNGIISSFGIYDESFKEVGVLKEKDGASVFPLCAIWDAEKTVLSILSSNGKISFLSSGFETILETDLKLTEESDSSIESASMRWRRNGDLLAINFRESGSNKGRIVVLDRKGDVVSKSKSFFAGSICSSVDWNTDTNLINVVGNDFGISKSGANKTILFFERNGLPHGKMSLSPIFDDFDQICLNFNAFSDILAVSAKNKIAFYSCRNYFWYLKKVLTFDHFVETAIWTNSGEICVLLKNGALSVIRMSARFSLSSQNSLAVVNAAEVNISNLGKGTIPPPLCHSKIKIGSECAKDVIFKEKSEEILILNSENKAISYQIDKNNFHEKIENELKSDFRKFLVYKNGIFLYLNDENRVFAVLTGAEPKTKRILDFGVVDAKYNEQNGNFSKKRFCLFPNTEKRLLQIKVVDNPSKL
ncbi:putative elongator complex protein 1 [Bonamia ostreae]|uniref:Elongator complex protein 1 n=1 Tax=Bonamia ostreae TaxID=126728 RepID=A0ABV2ALD7_9EUKA